MILCGGTTKIPSLQQQLQDYFPLAEVLSSVPPDEVIAVGAAKQVMKKAVNILSPLNVVNVRCTRTVS